jgi:hypothetical protein
MALQERGTCNNPSHVAYLLLLEISSELFLHLHPSLLDPALGFFLRTKALLKMEGTYNDPANSANIIPSFLFDDGDPSEHIFHYLNQTGEQYPTSRVDNWTQTCSDPEKIFGSASALGPFVGCMLYANVTRDIAKGSLNSSLLANAADRSFLSNNSETISLSLRSTYTTCLAGYCATQAECAASEICTVGNLLTGNYELSAQGVAKCWLKLCTPSVQLANPDIAGVGVRIFPRVESSICFAKLH